MNGIPFTQTRMHTTWVILDLGYVSVGRSRINPLPAATWDLHCYVWLTILWFLGVPTSFKDHHIDFHGLWRRCLQKKKLPCRMVKELSLYMAVYATYKRNIIVQSSLRFISSMGNAVRIPHDGRCTLSAQVQRRAGAVWKSGSPKFQFMLIISPILIGKCQAILQHAWKNMCCIKNERIVMTYNLFLRLAELPDWLYSAANYARDSGEGWKDLLSKEMHSKEFCGALPLG